MIPRRLILLGPLARTAAGGAEAGSEETEAWRRRREQSLLAEDGWLTVAGLFWLEPGPNQIDALPDARFTLRGDTVTLQSERDVMVDGKPVRTAALTPDSGRIAVGSRTLFVIRRGGRTAIRMRDSDSVYRKQFHGLRWFPIKAGYRVVARWHAYARPATRAVPSVGGVTQQMVAPGEAEFTLLGQTMRLEPVLDGEGMMFVFRDRTAGKSTYGAGRFLDTAMPRGGRLVLDFNRAYNPPCAFTPYATCPLPASRNHLPVAIEAGELDYRH